MGKKGVKEHATWVVTTPDCQRDRETTTPRKEGRKEGRRRTETTTARFCSHHTDRPISPTPPRRRPPPPRRRRLFIASASPTGPPTPRPRSPPHLRDSLSPSPRGRPPRRPGDTEVQIGGYIDAVTVTGGDLDW